MMSKYPFYIESYFSSMGKSEDNFKRILSDLDEYTGVTFDEITCDFSNGNENNDVVEFLFMDLSYVMSAGEFLKILKQTCRQYLHSIDKSEDREVLSKFVDEKIASISKKLLLD